jgi:hypothetical protein
MISIRKNALLKIAGKRYGRNKEGGENGETGNRARRE